MYYVQANLWLINSYEVSTEAGLFGILPLVQSFIKAFLPEGMTKAFWLAWTVLHSLQMFREKKAWEVLILNYKIRTTTLIPQIFKFSLLLMLGILRASVSAEGPFGLARPLNPQLAPNYLDAV